MYWLYLTLFLASLLVPRFSEEPWFPTIVNREITEIVFIFVLSSIMLAIYILRDYQFVRHQRNFEAKQKEAAHLLKDLSSTYSYIGETNRKIEILRDIMANFPDLIQDGKQNRDGMYDDIMRAIRSFSGCENLVIRFYGNKDGVVVREIWSSEKFKKEISQKLDPDHILKDENRSMERQGEYLFLKARDTFGYICCYAIFHKNYIKKENIEIIRSLMVQALYLYSFLDRVSDAREVQSLQEKEKGDKISME